MTTDMEHFILERLYAREASLIAHANAIDQKASYILVAITFLSIQISSLLGKPHWHSALFVSGVFLAGAAVLVVLGTSFSDFKDEGADKLENWIDQQLSGGLNPEDIFFWLRDAACKRIANNQRIYNRRVSLLQWSFRAVCVAFALNLTTVIRAIF